MCFFIYISLNTINLKYGHWWTDKDSSSLTRLLMWNRAKLNVMNSKTFILCKKSSRVYKHAVHCSTFKTWMSIKTLQHNHFVREIASWYNIIAYLWHMQILYHTGMNMIYCSAIISLFNIIRICFAPGIYLDQHKWVRVS